jgi:hypothetical protein
MTIPFVEHTAEFQRVASLSRRVWSAEDLLSLASSLTEILRTPGGEMTLKPAQALALHDAGTERGLFGPLGVGEGKTLITLLLPAVLGAERAMLLLPGGLVEKTQRERLALSRHWRIPNTLRVFSYDMLGRVGAVDELANYEPDAIICDEVHRLKNKRAAVTRRVARYMHDRPRTMFCGVSGTVMDKSLKDFAHILLWSLKLGAPIPTSNEEIEEWAEALDHGVDPLSRRNPGALIELCNQPELAEHEPHIAVRHGFRRRLTETPGVVATIGEGEHVDCSIYVRAILHKVSAVTEANFAKLRAEWQTPDDWELTAATDIWRHAQELALGFHYVRVDKKRYGPWLRTMRLTCDNGESRIPASSVSTRESTTKHTLDVKPRISANTEPKIQTSGEQGLAPHMQGPPNTSRSGEKVTRSDLGRTGVSTSTDFQSPNLRSSTSGKRDAVQSAELRVHCKEASEPYTSTTITEQEEFEVYCATTAMQVSDISVTLSARYREQFPIFLEGARPPKEWLAIRSAWARFARETISRSRTFDSELHVAQACDAGRLPTGELEAWRAIKDIFESVTVPIWHDDSTLQACVAWMKKPGIVWVDHTFFGACLSALSGAPYYAEGGFTFDGQYIEDAPPGTSAIASLAANKEGKNLQKLWSRSLVVCPPSSAAWWEQVIGRTHRIGQEADEVIVDVLLGCRENFDACQKALAAAAAVRDVTGKMQKLLLADITIPSESEINAMRSPRWMR